MTTIPSEIAPEPQGAELATADRRMAPRFEATGKVSCHPSCGRPGELWPGHVRDISRTGIGLIMPRRWERGTILLLEVSPEGGAPRSLCACVIHSTRLSEASYIVGCAHGGDFDEEEIQALVGQNALAVEEAEPSSA